MEPILIKRINKVRDELIADDFLKLRRAQCTGDGLDLQVATGKFLVKWNHTVNQAK